MRTFFKRMAALAAAVAVTAFSGCSSTGNTSAENAATPVQTEAVSKTAEWNDLDHTEITAAMGMGWNL